MGFGYIMASALGSGIVCGIWAGFSTYFSIIAPTLIAGWVGFVGCTSYFTAGCGRNGFIRSMCSNYAGVLIGCTIISLSVMISNGWIFSAICTGFFTWVICFLAHIDLTKVVPCTFMGGFSAFATGGNWQLLVICLLLGNLVGLGSDYLGRYIYKQFMHKKDEKEDWVLAQVLPDEPEHIEG
ncbi:DUF1097 domain-containing protein [Eubacterium aggregans]|nr:DUF1097 domain-containing protein [Eubacterium aggregans]MDD4690957.1 DUF1097 domain-containing protein [Eubacterium aggregans]